MKTRLTAIASTLGLTAILLIGGGAPAQAYTVTDCVQLRDGTSLQYVKHNWVEKNLMGRVDGWFHRSYSCYV